MSTQESSTREEWPTFALDYEFNPGEAPHWPSLAPDEVVVYDPSRRRSSWMTAGRGSYVALEHLR